MSMSSLANQIGAVDADPAVLIVGGGPAGLFAACELLRHGVMPRIVERRLAPHHEARGTALQPATADPFQRGGLGPAAFGAGGGPPAGAARHYGAGRLDGAVSARWRAHPPR